MPSARIKNVETFRRMCRDEDCELPFAQDISVLGTALQIKNKTAPNRLACQPMEGCDGTPQGAPGELTLRRYERFAKGGAGLIWVEACAVLPQAKANPLQLHLHKGTLDAFKQLTQMIRQTAVAAGHPAPLLILQLTHSGRYSRPHSAPAPLIAYNNPMFEKSVPIASECILSDSELDQTVHALVDGAKLAQAAGFDGADIKSCHRYLVSETLSAFQRTGRYGGCFENRTRLLLDSVRGALDVCGHNFIVTTRLNLFDGFPYPYGFGAQTDGGPEPDLTEPAQLIALLVQAGVPLLNLTMGNPYVNPHVNRPFVSGGYVPPEHPLRGTARMLQGIRDIQKRIPHTPVICSGLSYLASASPHAAAGGIEEGWFSMAGYGRMTFAYPDFAADILHRGRLAPEKCCLACSKCSELMRAHSMAGCPVFDREIYLPIYRRDVLKQH